MTAATPASPGTSVSLRQRRDTGSAAVDEDDVRVLRLRLVEAVDDDVRIGHVLAARDGDQRSLGQVRPGLAVLPRLLICIQN